MTVSWSDLIEIESQSNHHIAHVCTFVAHNQFVSSHDLLAIFIFASLKRARIKSKITGESHQILSLRLFLFFYICRVCGLWCCRSIATRKLQSKFIHHCIDTTISCEWKEIWSSKHLNSPPSFIKQPMYLLLLLAPWSCHDLH